MNVTILCCLTLISLILLTGCTTAASERSTVPPPISSPLVLTDITLTPSGKTTSRYKAATVTIEGSLIVISNITNHPDTTRTETLRISIADEDSPTAYTVEPKFITIAADELNPDGAAAETIMLADRTFTLIPVNGDDIITYTAQVRLSELQVVMLTPLREEHITIDTASHLAYADASVLSVSGNIVEVGGIKNRTNGFNEDLTLKIADKTNPPAYTIAGGSTVTLAGTEINPSGITNITTTINETLTFTVIPTADNALPVKYYIVLVLGDLVQLELLGGTDGDLTSTFTLTEGTTPPTAPLVVKNCGVFPPSYRVLVGGAPARTTVYTLTATNINPYLPATYTGTLTLIDDAVTNLTFSPLNVTTSPCATSSDLLGTGTSTDDPYIIDNDRKLSLVAALVNGTNMTYGGRHYSVTRDIDLARPLAPWSKERGGQFTPIGDANASGIVFGGTFDCQGNAISNLYINTSGPYKGLFGVVAGGTIANCGLVNANVRVARTAALYVGSLVGQLTNGGAITKSYSAQAIVMITGTEPTASTFLGGLVGNNNSATISDSYSTGAVINSGNFTGGLVGLNSGMIVKSYSRMGVNGNGQLGGLVGYHTGAIENSYAVGNVTATTGNAGGLIGLSSGGVSNSYAIGQVIGFNNTNINGLIGNITTAGAMITASYWDTTTSGQTNINDAAVGRTTTQLQVAAPISSGENAVYVDWDRGVWDFRAGGYPRLKTVACANRQYITAATSTCANIP